MNLFIPSVLDWQEKGFKLRQETKYPESEDVDSDGRYSAADAMAIRLRIPGWLRSAPTVKVNGSVLNSSAEPGSYLDAESQVEGGRQNRVATADAPARAKLCRTIRNLQAFLYGPLVLAGDLGGEGLTEAHIIGPNLRVGAANTEQNGSPLGPSNRTPPVPDLEIPVFRAVGERARVVDQAGTSR